MGLYFAIPNFWVPTRARDRTLASRNAERIAIHVQRATRRLEVAAAKERQRLRGGWRWFPGRID